MSEWYGYDHDAPCTKATASFYFDGGIDTTDELLSSGSLRDSPWTRLQADVQDKWTLSMWLRPDQIFEPSTGDPGYQRAHGIWWIDDQDNGYFVDIKYIPNYGSSADNYFYMTISAGYGTDNYRLWEIPLDSNGNNINATGISAGAIWNINNLGEVNTRGFAHLVFVFDDTQGVDEDKFKVYWNSTLLVDTVYFTGPNGSGPSAISYSGNQFAHFGQCVDGGLTIGDPGNWYGWMGWISYCNNFAADQTIVDTLWNSGVTPSQTTITGLDTNMVHYELGTNATLQKNYQNGSITLKAITLTHDKVVYP